MPHKVSYHSQYINANVYVPKRSLHKMVPDLANQNPKGAGKTSQRLEYNCTKYTHVLTYQPDSSTATIELLVYLLIICEITTFDKNYRLLANLTIKFTTSSWTLSFNSSFLCDFQLSKPVIARERHLLSRSEFILYLPSGRKFTLVAFESFSFLWIFMWVSSVDFCLVKKWHLSQLKGFSSECTAVTCFSKLALRSEQKSHSSHLNVLAFSWTLLFKGLTQSQPYFLSFEFCLVLV